MRATLAVLGFAAGLAVIAYQSAVALPVAAGTIQQAATAAGAVQRAQYTERRRRGTVTKCYRQFVVGNYVCRSYRAW